MRNKFNYIQQLEDRSNHYKDVLYIILDEKERSRIQSSIDQLDNFIEEVKRINDDQFDELIPFELSKAFH